MQTAHSELKLSDKLDKQCGDKQCADLLFLLVRFGAPWCSHHCDKV